MDELAILKAEVAELRNLLSVGVKPVKSSKVGGRRRQLAWITAGIGLAAATVMGVAVASTPGNPADVVFIPLTTPHKILSNVSIAKAATNSTAVIGGATTVPTDATSVQMTVAVKSAAAGSLSVFPTDHASSSTADAISFAAGNVVATQVTKQAPGLTSKISFRNNGTATAVVTVTITGYSTQTTASNISGSGGTAGQVLTNTGPGAQWANLPPVTAGTIRGTGGQPGQVLVNNGATSSVWSDAGHAYGSNSGNFVVFLSPSGTTIGTLTVPAGTYAVSVDAQFEAFGSGRAAAWCYLNAPSGTTIQQVFAAADAADVNQVPIAQQGLITTTGGTIVETCSQVSGSATAGVANMVAIRVTGASGSVVASTPLARPAAGQNGSAVR